MRTEVPSKHEIVRAWHVIDAQDAFGSSSVHGVVMCAGFGLAGHPARREALRLRGGHVTFGTGREAFGHTLPTLSSWIGAHSDARPRARRR